VIELQPSNSPLVNSIQTFGPAGNHGSDGSFSGTKPSGRGQSGIAGLVSFMRLFGLAKATFHFLSGQDELSKLADS
jgi:hypothetical protein